jgi:opacity protein-like surface antigen
LRELSNVEQLARDFARPLRRGVGSRVALCHGGAASNIKATLPAAIYPPGGSSTSTEFGWTAGSGIEFGITDNDLYVDLQSGSCSTMLCGVSVPVSFETSLVRAGLNLKFNPF